MLCAAAERSGFQSEPYSGHGILPPEDTGKTNLYIYMSATQLKIILLYFYAYI